MNLKSHINFFLFRNVTHSNTPESKYNSQFYTMFDFHIDTKVKHNFAID